MLQLWEYVKNGKICHDRSGHFWIAAQHHAAMTALLTGLIDD